MAPQITAINSQSVAAKLGFEINDVIVSINDKKINSVTDHNNILIELANKYKLSYVGLSFVRTRKDIIEAGQDVKKPDFGRK